MSSVKKCALVFAGLIAACDAGVVLIGPSDLRPPGDDPPSPGPDLAETVVDVQLINCAVTSDGLIINPNIVNPGPSVDYDIKSACINPDMFNGATGFISTQYECAINVAASREKYDSSNHFVLTYEDKSVTPQLSLENGSVSQGVQSSVGVTVMSAGAPLRSVFSANTSDTAFVRRQLAWTGRPSNPSLRFSVFLSCVKNTGTSPLKDANVPNLFWQVQNLQLHMSQ